MLYVTFDLIFDIYGYENTYMTDVSSGYHSLASKPQFSKFNPLRILSSSILGEDDAEGDGVEITGTGLNNSFRRELLIDSLKNEVDAFWNDISNNTYVSMDSNGTLYNVYLTETAAISSGNNYTKENGSKFSTFLANYDVYTDTTNVPALDDSNSLLQNVVDKEYNFQFLPGDKLHLLIQYIPESNQFDLLTTPVNVNTRTYEIVLNMN